MGRDLRPPLRRVCRRLVEIVFLAWGRGEGSQLFYQTDWLLNGQGPTTRKVLEECKGMVGTLLACLRARRDGCEAKAAQKKRPPLKEAAFAEFANRINQIRDFIYLLLSSSAPTQSRRQLSWFASSARSPQRKSSDHRDQSACRSHNPSFPRTPGQDSSGSR